MTTEAGKLPPGAVLLEDTVVPAEAPWSARIGAGQHLRLIDMEGRQSIDFLCYNANDPKERYHAANTIKVPCNIYLGKGSILRSSLAQPMMTITAPGDGPFRKQRGGCWC